MPREECYLNGTLLVVPYRGKELGLFVHLPDGVGEEAKPGPDGMIHGGLTLELVFGSSASPDDWEPADPDTHERFFVVLQRYMGEHATARTEPVELPSGDVVRKAGDAPIAGVTDAAGREELAHKTIVGVMKKALEAFVGGGLN